ncbi:hypothetical protein L7F22_007970 [Adiantum nelumboides]|nr:hypothetical protein [Adiantum nelumboides]
MSIFPSMDRKNVSRKRKQADLSTFYKFADDKKKRREKEIQIQHDHVFKEIFGDGPAIGEDDNDEVQEEQGRTDSEQVQKEKKHRRWRPAWKLEHPWAYPVLDNGKVKVKCEWCVYNKCKSPFANKGSSTLQLPGLSDHSKYDEHKATSFKWANNALCIPLPDYVATYDNKEKVRVITVMWQVYFVVKCAGPMELFEKLCLHQIEQGFPNMPNSSTYGTYLNRTSGLEFVQAIGDVLWVSFCKEVQASPWYSLMADDSTDRGKEGHLIIYVNYLKGWGTGDNHVAFARLIKVDDGGAEAKYGTIIKLIDEMGLCLQKLVSFAADGCSVMMGCRGGLLARMKAVVPHLLPVHRLAHRENLVASQAVGVFSEFMHLDKLCRSIYSWLHSSRKRFDDFKLIEGALDLPDLAMLQIHTVRWLSRGQVMEHMVKIMPALFIEFGKEKPSIYDELTTYAIQLCIHLLADVCTELNVLNCQFQSDIVDIANISGYVEATLRNLEKKFFRDSKNCGTK